MQREKQHTIGWAHFHLNTYTHSNNRTRPTIYSHNPATTTTQPPNQPPTHPSNHPTTQPPNQRPTNPPIHPNTHTPTHTHTHTHTNIYIYIYILYICFFLHVCWRRLQNIFNVMVILFLLYQEPKHN